MTDTRKAMQQALADRIRAAITEVRRKSYPLSDLIPMMQEAADALAQQGEQQPVAVIEGTRMWINGVEGSTVKVLRPGEWPEKGTFLYAGAAPAAQPLTEWDIRGRLAKLKCWHRLTEDEAAELVALAQQGEQQPVAQWERVQQARLGMKDGLSMALAVIELYGMKGDVTYREVEKLRDGIGADK